MNKHCDIERVQTVRGEGATMAGLQTDLRRLGFEIYLRALFFRKISFGNRRKNTFNVTEIQNKSFYCTFVGMRSSTRKFLKMQSKKTELFYSGGGGLGTYRP